MASLMCFMQPTDARADRKGNFIHFVFITCFKWIVLKAWNLSVHGVHLELPIGYIPPQMIVITFYKQECLIWFIEKKGFRVRFVRKMWQFFRANKGRHYYIFNKDGLRVCPLLYSLFTVLSIEFNGWEINVESLCIWTSSGLAGAIQFEHPTVVIVHWVKGGWIWAMTKMTSSDQFCCSRELCPVSEYRSTDI